jgi:hypothetical protein
MRDDTLPHQIRLRFISGPERPGGGLIGVFCTCSGRLLAAQLRWDDPGEPMAIWRQHMAEVT